MEGKSPIVIFGPGAKAARKDILQTPSPEKKISISVFNTAAQPPKPALSEKENPPPRVSIFNTKAPHTLSFSHDDIKARALHLNDRQIEAARLRLNTINLDEILAFQTWGQETQEKVGRYIEEKLTFLQNPQLKEVDDLIRQIIACIGQFHLPGNHLTDHLRSLFSLPNPASALPNQLDEHMAQLRHKLLDLKALLDSVRKQAIKGQTLLEDIAVDVMTISFLNGYFQAKPEYQDKGQLKVIQAKTDSLIQSEATLLQHVKEHQNFEQSLTKMIDQAQEILLSSYPAWRAQYLSLSSLKPSHPQRDLFFEKTRTLQQTLLNQLKALV